MVDLPYKNNMRENDRGRGEEGGSEKVRANLFNNVGFVHFLYDPDRAGSYVLHRINL